MCDSFGAHDFETHRVGQTELVIAVWSDPTVDGRALHRTRDESDLMGRFAIELVEKTDADLDTDPAREQRMHFRHDKICGKESLSLDNERAVPPGKICMLCRLAI